MPVFFGAPGAAAGGGGDTATRHAVRVPLAGLELTNDAVDAGFVLGGRHDQAVYNDAILEETETARKKADNAPTADEITDDLW